MLLLSSLFGSFGSSLAARRGSTALGLLRLKTEHLEPQRRGHGLALDAAGWRFFGQPLAVRRPAANRPPRQHAAKRAEMGSSGREGIGFAV
jgi:hypothetical protein